MQIESDIKMITDDFIPLNFRELNKAFIYIAPMDFDDKVLKVPLVGLVERVIKDCLCVSALISFSLWERSFLCVIC